MGEVLWSEMEDGNWLVRWPDILRRIEDVPLEPGLAGADNGDVSLPGFENGITRRRRADGLSELISFLMDAADSADQARAKLTTRECGACGATISGGYEQRRDLDRLRGLVVSALRGDVANLIERLLRLARAEREVYRGNAYRSPNYIFLLTTHSRHGG